MDGYLAGEDGPWGIPRIPAIPFAAEMIARKGWDSKGTTGNDWLSGNSAANW